jgi:hypothetical protein
MLGALILKLETGLSFRIPAARPRLIRCRRRSSDTPPWYLRLDWYPIEDLTARGPGCGYDRPPPKPRLEMRDDLIVRVWVRLPSPLAWSRICIHGDRPLQLLTSVASRIGFDKGA